MKSRLKREWDYSELCTRWQRHSFFTSGLPSLRAKVPSLRCPQKEGHNHFSFQATGIWSPPTGQKIQPIMSVSAPIRLRFRCNYWACRMRDISRESIASGLGDIRYANVSQAVGVANRNANSHRTAGKAFSAGKRFRDAAKDEVPNGGRPTWVAREPRRCGCARVVLDTHFVIRSRT